MNFKPYHYLIVCILVLTGCKKDEYISDNDLENHLIVEGYVFAHEPVRHFRISSVDASGRASSAPAIDISGKIWQGNTSADLVMIDSLPGFYITPDTLLFGGTESLHVTVSKGGNSYHIATWFPEAITGLTISNPSVNLDPDAPNAVLTGLTWNPVEAGRYCIFLRDLSGKVISSLPGTDASPSPFRMVHTDTIVNLRSADFGYTGVFQLYVTAVNDEYYNLMMENSEPISGNSQTGSTGLSGVFTAFNGEFVTITVQ